ERVPGSGADGIEIYTGTYAAAFRVGDSTKELAACAATAARAHERGLVVNAGHDLNLDNLPPLVTAMPFLAEASIGHELTADALVMGFAAAVKAYKAALTPKPQRRSIEPLRVDREDQRIKGQHEAAPALVIMPRARFRHRPEPPRGVKGDALDAGRRLILALDSPARRVEAVELAPAQCAARYP